MKLLFLMFFMHSLFFLAFPINAQTREITDNLISKVLRLAIQESPDDGEDDPCDCGIITPGECAPCPDDQ